MKVSKTTEALDFPLDASDEQIRDIFKEELVRIFWYLIVDTVKEDMEFPIVITLGFDVLDYWLKITATSESLGDHSDYKNHCRVKINHHAMTDTLRDFWKRLGIVKGDK